MNRRLPTMWHQTSISKSVHKYCKSANITISQHQRSCKRAIKEGIHIIYSDFTYKNMCLINFVCYKAQLLMAEYSKWFSIIVLYYQLFIRRFFVRWNGDRISEISRKLIEQIRKGFTREWSLCEILVNQIKQRLFEEINASRRRQAHQVRQDLKQEDY